jgi:hypothetical protein
VDPRAGLYDVERRIFLNLSGLELRPLGRPARSQSLYRLRYPGSYLHHQIPVVNDHEAGSKQGRAFVHEDGGDMFFRNVGSLSADCTALYSRR